MLKRTMTAALMIALVITAGSASAQCAMGVYADAAGTEPVVIPTQFVPFNAYVILRDEAAVEGASYQISFPAGVSVITRAMGANGLGFEFLTDSSSPPPVFDTIAGFGECVIGFGGNDILVATYGVIALDGDMVDESIVLAVNPTDPGNPATVEYATCSGQVVSCDNTQDLLIARVIGTVSTSFGAVKSLY